ncbi:unnamed protein product [Coregonus sp. 'balchen']|nr:unnamed protein product [Coregonus sp. 'balchen']
MAIVVGLAVASYCCLLPLISSGFCVRKTECQQTGHSRDEPQGPQDLRQDTAGMNHKSLEVDQSTLQRMKKMVKAIHSSGLSKWPYTHCIISLFIIHYKGSYIFITSYNALYRQALSKVLISSIFKMAANSLINDITWLVWALFFCHTENKEQYIEVLENLGNSHLTQDNNEVSTGFLNMAVFTREVTALFKNLVRGGGDFGGGWESGEEGGGGVIERSGKVHTIVISFYRTNISLIWASSVP